MKNLLKEPLLHFLLIGGGLFFLYSFLNPNEEQIANNVIKIEESDVDRLVKAYEQNWSTPPDKETLKSLLTEEIKSEVFYREALRMQLDHNDEIIRRRLKQKYEFLVKDLADSQQPNEAALKAFYEEKSELYKEPTKLSFSQIYFSPDKRQQPLADAQGVLQQVLSQPTKEVAPKQLSDNFHLQNYFADRDYNDVRQLFGQDFAKAIFSLEKEGWSSPVQSGYGIHLVNITTIQNELIKPYQETTRYWVQVWRLKPSYQFIFLFEKSDISSLQT